MSTLIDVDRVFRRRREMREGAREAWRWNDAPGEGRMSSFSRVQEMLGKSAVSRVPIDSLIVSDSPRLRGESVEHVLALAESEEDFPPIWVHRPSGRVIDGAHRVRAAVLRSTSEIDARFFHGSETGVFLLCVSANIRHGLPLSQDDRVAAAQRIFVPTPSGATGWSPR
ncbi:hypothetical protein ABZ926_37710 [Streptomyces litmocidini]|uniref:hypothetical protein n=1 Tax=Streptomyces litmocidini TaxID=67318 RepID=UPI0033D10D98